MKNFDFGRAAAVVRYMYMVERTGLKPYAVCALVVGLGWSLLCGIGCDAPWRWSAGCCSFVAGFMWLLLLASTFCGLRTKTRRIAFLALPASQGEKFVARIAFYIGAFVAISAAMLLVAELTTLVLCLIRGIELHSVIWAALFPDAPGIDDMLGGATTGDVAMWGMEDDYTRDPYMARIDGIITNCFTASAYILGSVALKRHAFFHVSWLLVLSVFATMIAYAAADADFFAFGIAMKILMVVFTALNIWAAWAIYKRTQCVPGHKFLDI